MRFLVVAIMIILLPLRSWVGDAMATQMATPSLAQQVASADVGLAHIDAPMSGLHGHDGSAQADTVPAAADCAGHDSQPSPPSSDAPHCQSCVVCQACSTVALAIPASAFDVFFAFFAVPPSVAPRFASADRALGLKPPIS